MKTDRLKFENNYNVIFGTWNVTSITGKEVELVEGTSMLG